MHKPTNSTLP